MTGVLIVPSIFIAAAGVFLIGDAWRARREAARRSALATNDTARLDALDRDHGRTIRPSKIYNVDGWTVEGGYFYQRLRSAIDAKLIAEDVGR